jgi:hypothetical protein
VCPGDLLRRVSWKQLPPQADAALPEVVYALRLPAETGERTARHDFVQWPLRGDFKPVQHLGQPASWIVTQLLVGEAAPAGERPPCAANAEEGPGARPAGIIAKCGTAGPSQTNRRFRARLAIEPVGGVVVNDILQNRDEHVERMPGDRHRTKAVPPEKIEKRRRRMPMHVDHAFRRQRFPGRFLGPLQRQPRNLECPHQQIAQPGVPRTRRAHDGNSDRRERSGHGHSPGGKQQRHKKLGRYRTGRQRSTEVRV